MLVDERKVVDYSGGAEKIICEFANEFTRRGYTMSIVCMDEKLGLPFHPLDEKVNFVNLCYDYGKPFGGVKWFAKKLQREVMRGIGGKDFIIAGKRYQDPKQKYFFDEFIRRLTKCIDDLNPEIIIAVSEDSAYIAQQACDLPVIAMCHGNPMDFADKFSAEQKTAWRKSRYIQVLQPRFLRELKRRGYQNTVVIPNVVEQVDDDKIVDTNVCRKKIMTAGRLEGDAKRQHLLLEAFSLLVKKFPDWSLDIYGAADNAHYQKKLLRMVKRFNIAEHVRFLGVTDHFFSILPEYDIFAFPSRREGFGLALAEAMSVGLPVVACRECYPDNEFIKDNETGLLVEEYPRDFAEKLSRLMTDSALRQRLGRAAHNAMRNYAAPIVWNKWEQIIQDV